jgi:hypothetical protein
MARLVLLCAALLVVLSGCGNRHDEPRTFAESEGLYLELGEVYYQIQISRQLNEEDVTDRDMLVGIPESVQPPADDEAYFGVFVRAWNFTDEPLPVAQDFEIIDANEDRYFPVRVEEDVNVFSRWPETLEPGRVAPEVESTAFNSPIGGRLVLFKLPYATFQQRPLEFRIKPDAGDEGIVDLDV